VRSGNAGGHQRSRGGEGRRNPFHLEQNGNKKVLASGRRIRYSGLESNANRAGGIQDSISEYLIRPYLVNPEQNVNKENKK